MAHTNVNPYRTAWSHRKPRTRIGAAFAVVLLLAVLPACSLITGGGDEATAEASDDAGFETSDESTFPTDDEFAAQQAEAQQQDDPGSDVAAQIGQLSTQVAEQTARATGLQGRVDELNGLLAAAEAGKREAVSSTNALIAEEIAAAEMALTEAVSSTVAFYEQDYISLERARLAAIRYARANPEIYGEELLDVPLAWELESESESAEFYYVRLHYRPSGTFLGTPGIEEFILDKEGNVEFRQILREPSDAPPPVVEEPAVTGEATTTEGGEATEPAPTEAEPAG